MKDPLLDVVFLDKLYRYSERELYAKIILLTFDEYPIEEIQGRVTQGNINLNGSSAVRRTCNLTLVASDMDVNAFHWGLHTKFKLEIGLKNFVDRENYPEIIWIPEGIFVITALNTAQAMNGFTLSIQGQDKMCLLNGSIGGVIGQSVNFGQFCYDDIELNTEVCVDRKLKEIIFSLVHTYGLERIENIVVDDVANYGIELLEYRAEEPLYLFKKYLDGVASDFNYYENMTMNGDQTVYAIIYDEEGEIIEELPVQLKDFAKFYTFDTLNENEELIPTKVYLATPEESINRIRYEYTVSQISAGQTAGYRPTDLVYPGDLITNPGETVTSVLDKIVKVLGNFEYFYDVYGRFIFQEKAVYLNTPWNAITRQGETEYINPIQHTSSYDFSFENGKLVTAFNNAPNIQNMKNDYFVHGVREGVGGAKIPIHMRYAIAKKPVEYTTITVSAQAAGKYGNAKPQTGVTYRSEDWDWRELIYQMARDYYQYGMMDDFFARVRQANRLPGKDLYPSGRTGYEMFYSDMISFWRDLYDPDAFIEYEPAWSDVTNTSIKVIEDKNHPIYGPITDENGLMTYTYLPLTLNSAEFEVVKGLGKYYRKLPYEDMNYILVSDNDQTLPIDYGTTYFIYTDKEGFEPIPFDQVREWQSVNACYRARNKYKLGYGWFKLIDPNISWIPETFILDTEPTLASHEKDPFYTSRIIDASKKTEEEILEEEKEVLSKLYTLRMRNNDLTLSINDIRKDWNKTVSELWDSHILRYYYLPYKSSIEVIEDEDGTKLGYGKHIEYTSSTYEEIQTKELFVECVEIDNIYIYKEKGQFLNSNFIEDEIPEGTHYYKQIGDITTVYKKADSYSPAIIAEIPFFRPAESGIGEFVLITSQEDYELQKSVNNCFIYEEFDINDWYKLLTEEDEFGPYEVYYEKTDRKIIGYHTTFTEYKDIYEYDSTIPGYVAVLTKNGRTGLYEPIKIEHTEYQYIYSKQPDIWYTPEDIPPIEEDSEDTFGHWVYDEFNYYTAVSGYQLIKSEETDSGYLVVPGDFTVFKLIEDPVEFSEAWYTHNRFQRFSRKTYQNYEPDLNRKYYTKTCQFFKPIDGVDKSLYYWNKQITTSPETLNYWIDFLDGDDLAKYSINIIGDRPKSINDDKVSAIYFRETPSVIFMDDLNKYLEMHQAGETSTGYSYILLTSNFEDAFTISAQGKTAKQEMDNLIYNHSYCVESTTINTIPIYTLEPNTRISVYDEQSKINGEYIIQTLTLPLDHRGLTSIKATKVVDRIY